jgi:hypothetical protein
MYVICLRLRFVNSFCLCEFPYVKLADSFDVCLIPYIRYEMHEMLMVLIGTIDQIMRILEVVAL